MSDEYEKIIRSVVEGQVKCFVDGHPQCVEAVNWYKRRADKKQTLINSISKRVIRDLLCTDTRTRLVRALAPDNGDTGATTGVG